MKKVYPVMKNSFKIQAGSEEFVSVAGLTNFSPSHEHSVEEWYSIEDEGFLSAMTTAIKMSFDFQGKRVYGDAGNDFIADMAWNIGEDCQTQCQWTMPNGTIVSFTGNFDVNTIAGGEATNVDTLAFNLIVVGKPTITKASE